MKLSLIPFAASLAGLFGAASACTNRDPVIWCYTGRGCSGEAIKLPRGATLQDCFTGPPPQTQFQVRKLQALPECFGGNAMRGVPIDEQTVGGGPGSSCTCTETSDGPKFCATPTRREGRSTLILNVDLADENQVFDGTVPFEKELDLKCNVWTGGEPHIKTWNGTWYDWHGECDAVMLDAPDYANGEGLLMHVRTKIRYDYSYIESAAVKIGDDIVEVAGYGEYFINGVNQAEMPTSVSHHFASHESTSHEEHNYSIDLGKGTKLVIKTHKDIVSFGLDFDPTEDVSEFIQWFSTSRGLMGNFMTGELLARDGVTVLSNPNDLGQEWQVQDAELKLFQDHTREPQYPNKCLLPSPTALQTRRRLGEFVSREAAEKACVQWDTKDAKERCIYDVMATGDLSMASAGSF